MCWGMVRGEGRLVQRCPAEPGLMLGGAWEQDLWGQVQDFFSFRRVN